MAKWLSLASLAATLAIIAAGCARPDPEDEPASSNAGRPNSSAVSPVARTAESGADDAVRALIAGVRAKDPETFWEFLPPGYRDDVNELVREFAVRMDDRLYTRVLLSARRLTKVLREKKAFILEHPRLVQAGEAGQIDVESLAADWDGFVSLVESLIGSPQIEIEPLKTFDGSRFLAGPGRELMEQLEVLSALSEDDQFARNLEKLENVQVTLVSESEDGTEAVVRLESPDPEEEAREIPFVKVEGKWIPRDLAENWESRLAEYRREVEDFTSPENLEIAREQFEPLLDTVDVVVAQLDKAESQEAFNTIVQQQILGPFEFLLKNAPGAQAGQKPKPKNASQSVTVIVRGDVEDTSELEAALQKAAGGADLTIVEDQGATRIDVTNVADLEAFARTIEFGKVTSVDPKTRTVTIEVPEKDATE